MNTNRPEDRWTSFNHKRRQNASAIFYPWCDEVMGGSPPGSAGVPPAPSLAQPRPSPPPESTGSGTLALLRPGRCCSRRQDGCLQHRTEAQRPPKGTECGRDARAPRRCRPGGAAGGWRPTSQKADVHPLGNSRLPASRPPPWCADHSRKNGRSLMKMNHEWTRMNTNRPEDRWTSFNHKRRQNASAIFYPWCDEVMG